MHCLLDVRVVHCCLACFQGVVLPPVARRAEPHVLPVRVRQQQQLQPADQPRLQRQPGPPPLLPLHRQIHCHGKQHVGLTRGKKRLRLLADLLRLTRRKRVGLIAAGMETRKHCMQGGKKLGSVGTMAARFPPWKATQISCALHWDKKVI